MKGTPFFKQAELVLRVLPHLHDEERFALKGGTALNFFVLDMPRLSVDIDLTFLPVTPRDEALQNISDALEKLADRIKRSMPDSKIERIKAKGEVRVTKLFVRREGALIKIEPNEIIRGTVFPCEELTLAKKAEDLFELSVSAHLLSIADLYGGKLCAALDRQHPRDLFDVKLLLESSGLTDDIRRAFVIYLASHNRPMNELLNPSWQDIRQTFENEFKDISAVEVTCDDLIATRDAFLKELLGSLTLVERQFLLSIKKGEPEWDLMGLDGIDRLPALQWKIQNVRRMPREKNVRELTKLRRILNL
ncbi:MAG: nucleotidyl transferase AbiEii/AbiGii toxin family protein [Proteobacteria bacterium]|nr:nucleotidyl transferase AbiEii/AbiGii toxin family protein [Pseudomonadota bacterium]